MNNSASAMMSAAGHSLVLRNVDMQVTLRDLRCEVTVTQTYRNDEAGSIEAVYTFPLPLDAVLLELEIELAGRRMQAMVVEKQRAERRYEDAIGEGDSAVMLEMLERGLYTANVGNLLTGETAVIRFTYSLFLRWNGDSLRLLLPTVIAPRYGASTAAPHQQPEVSLAVENRFTLNLDVAGVLSTAQFDSPSHTLTLQQREDGLCLTLDQEHAIMDRDFVLNVKAPQAPRSFAQLDGDGEAQIVFASFVPFFPGLRKPRPLKLAVVVDCSGSMAGDSIIQARRALDGMLDLLRPDDHLTIIAFGSACHSLVQRVSQCDPEFVALARQFCALLHANLGGTDIAKALEMAYLTLGDEMAGDIFLITDGEVNGWENVVTRAREVGHRIFTVGVGHAVSEAFVTDLARATHGECELLAPREDMADRVLRHFERMRAPRARRVAVSWPAGVIEQWPSAFGPVFEGDTIFAHAQISPHSDGGTVTLDIETEDGAIASQTVSYGAAPNMLVNNAPSTLARLAAHARMLSAPNGLELALRYRLVSPWTNWLVVAERLENATAELPTLRKVPQTLAAGWGGTGNATLPGMGSMKLPVFKRTGAPLVSKPADFQDDFLPAMQRVSRIRVGHSGLEDSDLFRQVFEAAGKTWLAVFAELSAAIDADPDWLAFDSVAQLFATYRLESEFEALYDEGAREGLSRDWIAVVLFAAVVDTGKLKLHTPAAKSASQALLAHVSLTLAKEGKASAHARLSLLAREAVTRYVTTGYASSRSA